MSREVLLSRIESFSAAHRLYNPSLTEAENNSLFGKCAWANGHGHNYKVEVRVKGKVDPVSGMVMNLSDLKPLIQRVLDQVDHRCLDKDVPYFADKPSTAENIAIFFWEELVGKLPDGVKLNKVKVWETEKNFPAEDITVWIDPLDATKEYTEKLTQYVTVMACIAVNGIPVAGVIRKPFDDKTYWGWVSDL
eukprot:sb/3471085/